MKNTFGGMFLPFCFIIAMASTLAMDSARAVQVSNNASQATIPSKNTTQAHPATASTMPPISQNATPTSLPTPRTNSTLSAPLPLAVNSTKNNNQNATRQDKTPPPSRQKKHNATTPASNSTGADGWISVSTGARPVYVGIHGGTAPLSLVRASNGTLFALTGQTGNDFVHVLKGGGHNSSSKHTSGTDSSNATTKETADAHNATHLSTAASNGNATSKDRIPDEWHATQQNATQTNSSVKTTAKSSFNATHQPSLEPSVPSSVKQAAAYNSTSASIIDAQPKRNATQPAAQKHRSAVESEPQQAAPASDSAKKTLTAAQPAPAASATNKTQPHSILPEAQDAPISQNPPSGTQASASQKTPQAAKPSPYPNTTLVIASGELASQLRQSSDPLLPFGLSAEDNQQSDDSLAAATVPPKRQFRKLKLGSYKHILSRRRI